MKQSKKLTRNQRIALEKMGVPQSEMKTLRFYRVLPNGDYVLARGITLVSVGDDGTLVPYES